MNNGTLTVEKTQKKKRAFARLGYTKEQSNELVAALNELLANYQIHYQKLKNFHWNVKGPDFFDIHEKLEEQYIFAREAIDAIAERIRVFGQIPFSTLREYLETSEIKESGTDLSAREMVKVIIKDYEILLGYMFNVIEQTIEYGDSGTEDLVKGFIKQTEKNHWMMTSFSYQG